MLLLELTYLKCADLHFPLTPCTLFKISYHFHKHSITLCDACFCPLLEDLFLETFLYMMS